MTQPGMRSTCVSAASQAASSGSSAPVAVADQDTAFTLEAPLAGVNSRRASRCPAVA